MWPFQRKNQSRSLQNLQEEKATCPSQPEEEKQSQPEKPPIGYRVWVAELLEDGWKLRSSVADYWWEGPVGKNASAPKDGPMYGMLISYDNKPKDHIGFHCSKSADPTKLRNYTQASAFVEHKVGVGARFRECEAVFGEVEPFGAIQEGTDGYVSQGLTIRKLWVSRVRSDLIKDLERRYQCDVEIDGRLPQPKLPEPIMRYENIGTMEYPHSIPIYWCADMNPLI